MSTTTTQTMLLSEQIARIAVASSAGQTLPGPTLAVAPPTVASSFKRAMDVAGAAVGLLLLAPLLLLVALAVRLSSPGPVLFRQLRLGRGGRPFSPFASERRTSTATCCGSRLRWTMFRSTAGIWRSVRPL